MESPVTPLVVFMARESTAPGSRIEVEEWLMSSLKHVPEEHGKKLQHDWMAGSHPLALRT